MSAEGNSVTEKRLIDARLARTVAMAVRSAGHGGGARRKNLQRRRQRASTELNWGKRPQTSPPCPDPHPRSNRRWDKRKLSYSYVNESRGQVSWRCQACSAVSNVEVHHQEGRSDGVGTIPSRTYYTLRDVPRRKTSCVFLMV